MLIPANGPNVSTNGAEIALFTKAVSISNVLISEQRILWVCTCSCYRPEALAAFILYGNWRKREQMNLTTVNPAIPILIAGLVLAIGIALWMYMKKERTQKLRSKFGTEYDKAIGEHKDRGHAESELQKRAARVAKFNIHPLKAEERARYTEDWRREQSLFVDDPRGAVNHADTLVQDVMRRRGYPVGEFDQNAADLSVDHPRVVENYRAAHEIAIREGQGPGNTEDLRRAMVSYRALFDDLVGQPVEKPEEVQK